MAYTHLTTDELVMIESYYHQDIPVTKIAAYLKRTRTPFYNVITFLKEGHTALEYFQQYKVHKKYCWRRKIRLPKKQQAYIKEKFTQRWTPDVIIDWAKEPIDCSVFTPYRQFKEKIFDETILPMKGKRKTNDHKESQGNRLSNEISKKVRKIIPNSNKNLAISKSTPL